MTGISFSDMFTTGVWWVDGIIDSGVKSLDIYWHPRISTYDGSEELVIRGADQHAEAILAGFEAVGATLAKGDSEVIMEEK